jgi:hypothetical protein
MPRANAAGMRAPLGRRSPLEAHLVATALVASALCACADDGAPLGPGDTAGTGVGGGGEGGAVGGGGEPTPIGGGDAGTEAPEDAGAPAPCGCFAGNGTYCADRVTAHAQEQGCTPPAAAAEHAGELLSCHGGTWRWDTTCRSACGGDASAEACDAPAYQFPWRCDKQHLCTADNADDGHHEAGSISEFAYDFSMASDTKLRAARGGVVKIIHMETEPGDPCYQGCGTVSDYCANKCGDKANILTIRHSDGTVSQYVHLNAAAPGLHEGQRVEQGELIAYSGNTGWSTGPHLHFMVMKKGCTSTHCQSIPIEFAGVDHVKKGQTYTSDNCP